jgi:predicted HicB family RNase H-like nuclease
VTPSPRVSPGDVDEKLVVRIDASMQSLLEFLARREGKTIDAYVSGAIADHITRAMVNPEEIQKVRDRKSA